MLPLLGSLVTQKNSFPEKKEGKTEFNPHWFLSLQGGGAYTLGEADILRRAMSKKKHEIMDSERENLFQEV